MPLCHLPDRARHPFNAVRAVLEVRHGVVGHAVLAAIENEHAGRAPFQKRLARKRVLARVGA